MIVKDLLKNPSIDRTSNEQLLQAILQKNRSFLISHDDYCLTKDELTRYQNAVNQWQQGKPLAYILGYQGFWKHDFLVNQHTLIPRPDTELLVETVLNFIQRNSLSRNLQILDLGTGSGCIAISLAFENPKAIVTAVDFSADALTIAKKNAKNIGITNVQFLQSDWYQALKSQTFDIIVSNPPYIDPNDLHLTALSDEPITALIADNHGLADIEQIVKNAKGYLQPQGLLAIEHGYNQGRAVQAIFTQYRFKDIKTIKDYGGNDRVTLGIG